MFEISIKALVMLAATGGCLEADVYPPGRVDEYIVADRCAIPDVDVTGYEAADVTEIVVGFEPAADGRPVLVPIIAATATDDAGGDFVYLEASGDSLAEAIR